MNTIQNKAPFVYLPMDKKEIVLETSSEINIKGSSSEIKFDKVKGTITSWIYEGIKLIERGPVLNLWRAPIDNDRQEEKHWRTMGLNFLQQRIDCLKMEKQQNSIILVCKARIAPPTHI